jgi:predicted RNA binding protein YcfA (HicA-like mRNA interferase family)
MTRLPRDVSGTQLARLLEKYGYQITRQTGSHIRLTTQMNGEHHVTLPVHKELRVGTLSAVLTDIADHLGMERNDLVAALYER